MLFSKMKSEHGSSLFIVTIWLLWGYFSGFPSIFSAVVIGIASRQFIKYFFCCLGSLNWTFFVALGIKLNLLSREDIGNKPSSFSGTRAYIEQSNPFPKDGKQVCALTCS